MSNDTPKMVGPPGTVMTIEEPITSEAVMMPMVARSIALSSRSPKLSKSLKVQVHSHAAVAGVLDEPRKITRHRGEKVDEIAKSGLATSQDLGGLVALAHCAVDERLDAVKQAKLRIVLTAKPLEADERLEQQR